jgi:hypothetical protein
MGLSYNEISDLFEEIKYRYENLNDSDVLEAFSLMRDSSSLLSNYDQMSADAYKLTALYERQAKATEARKSCELAPKPTEGARKAACDAEVIDAWNKYIETSTRQKYIEANGKFLSRVYFDSKMIVEQCYRKERPPVGTDKIVGRT